MRTSVVDFLLDREIVLRGRSVGTCLEGFEPDVEVNSKGTGDKMIFPEVDSASKVCFPAVDVISICRTSESRGHAATILPFDDGGSGTSQIYTNLSSSADEKSRLAGDREGSHRKDFTAEACPLKEHSSFTDSVSESSLVEDATRVERSWIALFATSSWLWSSSTPGRTARAE